MKKATVIGTGMMGPGIAARLAFGGLEATVVSRTEDGAQRGLASAHRALTYLAEAGLISSDAASTAAERVRGSASLAAAAADVDIVVESAPENMAFKQQLFAELEGMTRPDTILASNTSGLSITAVAERCRRPERVLTTHFWNPPHLIPLVEIVRGERTSADVVETVRDLLVRCGKTPVVLQKDAPGQLGNRLQFALLREAIHIVQEGIATAEDVDAALKNAIGLRMPVYGLFEHMDAVGLDMAFSVGDYVMRYLNSEPEPPALFREKVESGQLGAKSGRGFHDWSSRDLGAIQQRRDEFVAAVLSGKFRQSSESTDRTASTSAP